MELSDDEKHRKKVMLVASVRSYYVAMYVKSISVKSFQNFYIAEEGRDIPFGEYGYHDLESFLIEEAGFRRAGDGNVSFSSENSAHITELLEGQKNKPRVAIGNAPRPSNRRRPLSSLPPRLRASTSSLGSKNLSPAANSIEFESMTREDLETHCRRVFTPPFRHQLRKKLQACSVGCDPDEFVEYFNLSNFEKFKVRKDLDLKGLTLMEFFHGLSDVFRVETEGGVVRLYLALTKSLSLDKLGNAAPARRSSYLPANTPPPSTSALSERRFPHINEVIPFFKQANDFYASRQVTMSEYLSKVRELGTEAGCDIAAWLAAQRFDMGRFSTFVTDKLSLPIDVVPGKDAIFIRGSPPQTVQVPETEVNLSALSLLKHEPFSIAFKHERLPCGGVSVDIEVLCFRHGEPNFYFTLIEATQRRLDLMKRLRREHAPFPQAKLEKGAPCIVRDEDQNLYRASIIGIGNGFVEVYLVDVGETSSVPIRDVFRISDEYLQEGIFAYPATLANVRPVDGGDTFSPKALQDIALELDSQIVKAHIISFNADVKRYEVDLLETASQLEESNLLKYDHGTPRPVPSNGPHSVPTQINNGQHRQVPADLAQSMRALTVEKAADDDLSKITFENRVLPNCETITVVHRDATSFVLSSAISRVLGLTENTFLSTLKKFCIAVDGSWEPGSKIMAILKGTDDWIQLSARDVLIPVASVAPLMRAFLYVEGRTLDNEKNVLKIFSLWAK